VLPGSTGTVRFVVNPSDAWVPTGTGAAVAAWELNHVEVTRAGYVTPGVFTVTAIEPASTDPAKKGEYIATVECDPDAEPYTDHTVALVLNTGTAQAPVLISSSIFQLMPREIKTYTPLAWSELPSIIDCMEDGDILDLSDLSLYPDPGDLDETVTVVIDKDITVTANVDPAQRPKVSTYFRNVHFRLVDGATVIFEQILTGDSNDLATPIVTGDGNIVIRDSIFRHKSTIGVIDLDGDVTIEGTFFEDILNNSSAVQFDLSSRQGPPNPAVRAHNVTVNGGAVLGYESYSDVIGSACNGGTAIEASGDVTITGLWIEVDGNMYASANIVGGSGDQNGEVWDGGDAIVAAGRVTVTGSASIMGGFGYGIGSRGGSGIVAGGDVFLSGERREIPDAGWFWSTWVSGGPGDTNGVAFRFSGDASSPSRTLTADCVIIREYNNSQTTRAPWQIELQSHDIAIFDNYCLLGRYSDVPIFSGGSYRISSPFAIRGTLDNATELP
jgi:hypothetical protein